MNATKQANKEVQIGQRQRYMAGELTHQEYYIWLSQFIGISCPVSLIAAAQRSKDPHYNDVPLFSWDVNDSWVRQAAYRQGLPWSLSDTVCCLKALARKAVEESK